MIQNNNYNMIKDKKTKIAFIATYPPRRCGIGTFTQNLYNSITENRESIEGVILAIDDSEEVSNYPSEVEFVIQQDHQQDYLEAAEYLNSSDTNICVLQHEYGIFGGQSGAFVLSMIHKLEIPLIVTFHTILKEPSNNEKEILQKICKKAQKIIVMSKLAIKFLIEVYNIDKNKIEYVQHGVPDLHFDQNIAKKELKTADKKLILTFGFVSRNKGIETVIKALPKVVKQHPDTLYIVLGKTHPNIIKSSGEGYRTYLQNLIEKLSLTDNVVLLNKFVTQEELFKYLSAADVYVTPYLNEAQITSGTLSYAVGVGTAVISTPYWHATELLAEGRGELFNFKDSEQLSSILLELFYNKEKLQTLRKKAYDYGRTITWKESGKKYVKIIGNVLKNKVIQVETKKSIIDPDIIPEFALDHIIRLTDYTGILQHTKYGIPNFKKGYCLDDNARALLMALMAYKATKDKKVLELATTYLSYIHYMQNEDGQFKNFLNFKKKFLEESVGSEDAFGRTIWALGYMLANAPNDTYYQSGYEIFFRATPHFDKLISIRAIAKTIIGLSNYLLKNMNDEVNYELLQTLSYKLINEYQQSSDKDWKWFETLLAYDNGILPLSLLHASELISDNLIEDIAMESMNFLTEKTLYKGYLSIIGNEKWYKKDGYRSIYAQQPLDVMAMVLMYQQAFKLTKDEKYLEKLFMCFKWFLGENDIRMSLIDSDTKGCCDGIESYGINRNQGAESTLAYLISLLAVSETIKQVKI